MKNEIYGQIDFTAKTPKILRNPGILPQEYTYPDGRKILGFHRCPGCKLRALGFCTAEYPEPAVVPEYDPETEKLEKKWVVESGKIKLAYEKIKAIEDKQVK